MLLTGATVAHAQCIIEGVTLIQKFLPSKNKDAGPMPAQARTLKSAIPVKAGTSRLEVAVSGMVRMVRDGCDKK